MLMSVVTAAGAGAGPVIVAHRGASKDAPENTLPAFELAWRQGADAIEGDFQLTADGRIICIHDKDTARVSGVKKVVKETSFAQLRELDAGGWFGDGWKGTRMPTLLEVAATVPAHGRFYIEVKSGVETVPVLLDDLATSGLKSAQVVVISFDSGVIREVKKRMPELRAFWLSSFAKAAPLDPGRERVLEVLREIRADGFSSSADARLDAGFVGAIRAAGFEYHCWTIDDPAIARRFLALGAGSVTTNRPGALRAGLGGG